MTLAAGTRLGSYQILGPLGVGGMGEVYRARDTKLSRDVAIKVLPAEVSGDAHRLERFEKEARTASALNHPNIVTIYEIDRWDSTTLIVMELVEGKTLREILSGGALPLKRLLALAAQAADGLAKAHAAGIVHRDLKPENLMVTRDGFVKILDFGLAKLVPSGDENSGATNLPTISRGTEEGTVLGTVGYMSPEQAGGERVDFRSDQFALGAILYEMAAGRRAFQRPKAVQTLSAIIQEEPEPLGQVAPKIPTSLVWIVERCLAKDPEERYGSTKDLARDLAALRDHSSSLSTTTSAEAPRRLRRIRALWVGLLLLPIGAGMFWLGNRRGQEKVLSIPPPTVRQLTYRRGFITGARFASDGQTVVYSAAWDGKPSEIFLTRIDGAESRPLGIFPAGILAISSTGELAIALGCEDAWNTCVGTLARVPLAGGAPREILDDVASADWAPDGKDLAAIHIVDGRYRIEYPVGKVLHQSGQTLSNIRFSPDGSLLSFVEHGGDSAERGTLCVLDRSGRKRALTPEFPSISSAVWSPAGDEIYFWGRVTGREARAAAVSLSGRVRAVYRPMGGFILDSSRQGRFLIGPGYLRSDIYGMGPGASSVRNLSWFDGSAAADLSSEGRRLLFYEWASAVDRVFSTYRRGTDGSDPALLGEGKALALSPDEKWALAAQPVPKPHLVLLPMGVGQPRSLPGGDIVRYHWASWFPDSQRVIFVAEEKDRLGSYVQDVAGGQPRRFAEDGLRISVVSPNGLEVAGSTTEGLNLILRADGAGRARSIEGTEPGDDLVQWSADGKSLYVRGAQKQPLVLYRVDLETGKRERWKELSPLDPTGFLFFGEGPRGVRITPDGGAYAYTYWSRSSDLLLIEGMDRRD